MPLGCVIVHGQAGQHIRRAALAQQACGDAGRPAPWRVGKQGLIADWQRTAAVRIASAIGPADPRADSTKVRAATGSIVPGGTESVARSIQRPDGPNEAAPPGPASGPSELEPRSRAQNPNTLATDPQDCKKPRHQNRRTQPFSNQINQNPIRFTALLRGGDEWGRSAAWPGQRAHRAHFETRCVHPVALAGVAGEGLSLGLVGPRRESGPHAKCHEMS